MKNKHKNKHKNMRKYIESKNNVVVYIPIEKYSLWIELMCSEHEFYRYENILDSVVIDYVGDRTMCYCRLHEASEDFKIIIKQYPELLWLLELFELKDSI